MLIKDTQTLLEYLPLEKTLHVLGIDTTYKGSNILCPFHQETSASFHIYGPYGKCFGCNWSGDSFTAIKQLQEFSSTSEVLHWIDDNAASLLPATVQLDTKTLQKNAGVDEEATKFWAKFIKTGNDALEDTDTGRAITEWLSTRGCWVNTDRELCYGAFDLKYFQEKLGEKELIKYFGKNFKFMQSAVMFYYYELPNLLASIKFRDFSRGSKASLFKRIRKNIGFYAINLCPPQDDDNTIIITEGEIDAEACLSWQIKMNPSGRFFPITCCSGAAISKNISLLYKYGYNKILLWLDNDSGGDSNLQKIMTEAFDKGDSVFIIYPSDYQEGEDPADYIRRHMEVGARLSDLFGKIFSPNSKMAASTYIAKRAVNMFNRNGTLDDDERWNLWRHIAKTMEQYKLSGTPSFEYLKQVHKDITKWPELEGLRLDELTYSISNKVRSGKEIRFLNGSVTVKPDGYYIISKTKKGEEPDEIKLTNFTLDPIAQYTGQDDTINYKFRLHKVGLNHNPTIILTSAQLGNQSQFRNAMLSQVSGIQIEWTDRIMPNFLACLTEKCARAEDIKRLGWQDVVPGKPLEFCGVGWHVKDGEFRLWDDLLISDMLSDMLDEGVLDQYSQDLPVLQDGAKEYINFVRHATSDLAISGLIAGYYISGLFKPLIDMRRGALALEGPPENAKTEGSQAFGGIFYPYKMDCRKLLMSATSTVTALELRFSYLSGIPLTYDDIKSVNTSRGNTHTESMIQNYYDGQVRQRATQKLTIHKAAPPLANLILNGEHIPTGDAGVESRLLTIEVGEKEGAIAINPEALDRLAEHGQNAPKILPRFVQFLCKQNWGKISDDIKKHGILAHGRVSVYYNSALVGLKLFRQFLCEDLCLTLNEVAPLDETIDTFEAHIKKIASVRNGNISTLKGKFESKIKKKVDVDYTVFKTENIGNYAPNTPGYQLLQEVSSLIDTGQFVIEGINIERTGIHVGHLEHSLKVVWLEPHIVLNYLEKNGSSFTKKSMGSLTRQLVLDKDAQKAKKSQHVFRRRWPIKIDDFCCFSEIIKERVEQLNEGDVKEDVDQTNEHAAV